MGTLAQVLVLASAVVRATCQNLLDDFESPSMNHRPWYRYWLPDASIEHEELRKDVQALKDVGAGGMEFVPFYNYGFGTPSGPPSDGWDVYAFGSPAYKEVLTTALEALNDTGLSLDLAIGASQGQGVPVEPLTPGLAVHLVYGEATVRAGESYNGPVPEANLDPNLPSTYMHPHEIFGPTRLVGVVAGGVTATRPISDLYNATTLAESSLVDLTHTVVDGELSWEAPHDLESYKIFGLYETFTNQRSCDGAPNAQTPIQNGSWTTDHFSAAGAKLVTEFWETNLLDADIKALLRSVGSNSWEDSMEMQAALWWTPEFVDRFEKGRGYSPIKYLPLMFHQSNAFTMNSPPYNTTYDLGPDASDQSFFIQDYRTTLNEGYLEYLGTYEAWAQSLGLSHSCQVAYNLPLDMLGDVQEVSAPELESLGFPEIDQSLQFVGPAHLGGRNVISTEVGAVMTGGYSLTVTSLVGLFRDSFAGGVNHMKIHGMPYGGEYHATWPGYTPFQYSYSELWSPRQPAWNYLNDTMAYAARNQVVLQHGVAKRDVAFYIYKQPWLAETFYEGGDLRDRGFSHEYLGPLNLASDNMTFDDGLLAAEGPAYRALVFYNQTYISPEASKKVLSFAQGGLPIIAYGGLPNTTIGKAGQDVVTENMAAVAASGLHNVQFIDDPQGVADALEMLQVGPRMSVHSSTNSSGNLYSVWRSDSKSDTDFVFLYNKGDADTFELTFEVGDNKVPYKLNAWVGTEQEYVVYERSSMGITLSVSLQEGQTAIFGFGRADGTDADHVISHSANVERVIRGTGGTMVAWINNGAAATLQLSSGKNVTIPALAGNPNSSLTERDMGPWDLTLQSWEPSPDNTTSRSSIKTLPLGAQSELTPWSDIPGIQNISGVGIYTASFQSQEDQHYGSNQTATLIHFGPVLNTLRAWINDEELPPVDNTDAEVDISSYLVPGNNTIRAEVSSTLFNAVKARVDWVKQFGSPPNIPTMYTDAPRQPHGLVGPVRVRTLREVAVA